MFFQKSSPIAIEALAKIIDAKVEIRDALVSNVGPVDTLREGIIGCYHNTKYRTIFFFSIFSIHKYNTEIVYRLYQQILY